MTTQEHMAAAIDPGRILQAQGIEPDPWQRDLLRSRDRHILLNCCRGAGKTRTTSALAIHQAIFNPGTTTLIVSKAQRQAGEMFRYVKQANMAIGRPLDATAETETKIEFANGSRIVSLPGKEETIRGYQSVALLVLDEAARIPDDLYRTIRPMIATSGGRLIALSTPYGQRGWFWKEWVGEGPWKRIEIPWSKCPRYTAEIIREEKRAMGEAWVAQEYECAFTSIEGLVYPDFSSTYTDFYTLETAGKHVGGIDWGWRNPFAAIWGILDNQGVLWIQNERYERQCPLSEHMKHLPKNVEWYADKAGAQEISIMRQAGYLIRRGNNEIRPGISAINSRIRLRTLKILDKACPNLCSESKLYRYPSANEKETLGENPIDEHNHALGALRYLISRLDANFINKIKRETKPQITEQKPLALPAPDPDDRDDTLWTRIL